MQVSGGVKIVGNFATKRFCDNPATCWTSTIAFGQGGVVNSHLIARGEINIRNGFSDLYVAGIGSISSVAELYDGVR